MAGAAQALFFARPAAAGHCFAEAQTDERGKQAWGGNEAEAPGECPSYEPVLWAIMGSTTIHVDAGFADPLGEPDSTLSRMMSSVCSGSAIRREYQAASPLTETYGTGS